MRQQLLRSAILACSLMLACSRCLILTVYVTIAECVCGVRVVVCVRAIDVLTVCYYHIKLVWRISTTSA